MQPILWCNNIFLLIKKRADNHFCLSDLCFDFFIYSDILKVDFFKLVSLAVEWRKRVQGIIVHLLGLCLLVNRAYLYSLLSLSLIGHRHLVYNEIWYVLKDRNKWNWPEYTTRKHNAYNYFYFIHCPSVFILFNYFLSSKEKKYYCQSNCWPKIMSYWAMV